MKNRGGARSAIREGRDVLEDSDAPGTSSRSSSSDGGRKLRFTKLWVCTNGSKSRSSKFAESLRRRNRAGDFLAGLEAIEGTGSVSTEQKFSQTYFDGNSAIDAWTETTGRATADAEVSCRCETTNRSSGPDEIIEIRCVDRSRSSAAQTDAWNESVRRSGAESRRNGRRSRPIFGEGSSASPEELLETSEDSEAGLIYDGSLRCFPYPIELTGKPKYVATCESCESSTDKWVSISHGGLDAAVGSSIIIEASDEETEGGRKSVSCEICDDCSTADEGARSGAWESVDETRRSSRDESGGLRSRRRSRKRTGRDVSVGDESAGSADAKDENFAEESSVATREGEDRSADRRGSRSARGYRRTSSSSKRSGRSSFYAENWLPDESSRFRIEADDERGTRNESRDTVETDLKFDVPDRSADRRGSRSARGSEGSSPGGRRSGRSRIHDASRLTNDSSRSWNERTRGWLDDHEERESTLVPLHESTRLSLGSVEAKGGNFQSSRSTSMNKKPYSFTGGESKARMEDETEPRRCKARTSENPRNRRLAVAAVSRWTRDEKEPLHGCERDDPFVFALRKFTKPRGNFENVTSEFRHLLSGTCRISEFNNFGKRYDWDREWDPGVRRKYCKCGNGCGGLNSENKCCCHG